MGISIASRKQAAHKMIARWGGLGFLIRGAARRPATMAIIEYKPTERGLFLDGSTRIRVSAINLSVPPDFELDIIEFAKQQYKILMPPDGPRPTGEFVFYDCISMLSKNL